MALSANNTAWASKDDNGTGAENANTCVMCVYQGLRLSKVGRQALLRVWDEEEEQIVARGSKSELETLSLFREEANFPSWREIYEGERSRREGESKKKPAALENILEGEMRKLQNTS